MSSTPALLTAKRKVKIMIYCCHVTRRERECSVKLPLFPMASRGRLLCLQKQVSQYKSVTKKSFHLMSELSKHFLTSLKSSNMMFMLSTMFTFRENRKRGFSGAWSPSQQEAANVHGFIVSLKSARFPPTNGWMDDVMILYSSFIYSLCNTQIQALTNLLDQLS